MHRRVNEFLAYIDFALEHHRAGTLDAGGTSKFPDVRAVAAHAPAPS